MFKLDLKKTEKPEIKLTTIHWIIEKAHEFQKNIYLCFVDYTKAFDCVDHNKLWEILKDMGIPDHLTCLLRNQDASQEATFRTGYGTTDWFQIGKRVPQGCILSPCLFNSCKMPGWVKHKLESRLPGEISTISDMQMTPPYGRKWRTKEPLDENERGEWKVGLKLDIQKTKIMVSRPITSWQIDGEIMETVRDFILGGSKIITDGDCSHEIRRRSLEAKL